MSDKITQLYSDDEIEEMQEDQPEIEFNAGIYKLTWPLSGILVRVDRLRTEKENITGEVTIETTVHGHIHQARLNLTSTVTRNTLAKTLTKRVSEVDWYSVIEITCVEVLKIERQGEPALSILDVQETSAIKYQLDPLLVADAPTIVYGYGGSGKSFLGSLCAILIQSGKEFEGLKPRQGNVLYLDYETTIEEISGRIRRLSRGLGISPPNILYRNSVHPLASEVEEIQRLVIDRNIDYIILDSMGMACGGEPEKADVIIRTFGALRSLRKGVMVIDHLNKDGGLFGSIYKMNYSRCAWELRGVENSHEDTITTTLKHTKANNARKRQVPLALSLRFDGFNKRIIPASVNPATDPHLAEELPLKLRIRQMLADKPMFANELAEEMGGNFNSIRTTLNRCPEFEKVRGGSHDGKWTLSKSR